MLLVIQIKNILKYIYKFADLNYEYKLLSWDVFLDYSIKNITICNIIAQKQTHRRFWFIS